MATAGAPDSRGRTPTPQLSGEYPICKITTPFSDQLEDSPLALREDVAFSLPSDLELILQDIKYHLLDGSRKVTASFYHMMDRFFKHRGRAIVCDIT